MKTPKKTTKKQAPMRTYQYSAQVEGYWDGTVRARNKAEALKKAEEDIASEGMQPVGEIDVQRF